MKSIAVQNSRSSRNPVAEHQLIAASIAVQNSRSSRNTLTVDVAYYEEYSRSKFEVQPQLVIDCFGGTGKYSRSKFEVQPQLAKSPAR